MLPQVSLPSLLLRTSVPSRCSARQITLLISLTENKGLFFRCEGKLCTAMWPVVPAVEDMCSWDLTSDSSLPRLAFLRCESALSVKRRLKCWSKTWQCFSCLNEQITVGYHNSDKNCRCPPHIRTEGTEVESSWRVGVGVLALASRHCDVAGLFLCPWWFLLLWQGCGGECKGNCSTWFFSFSYMRQMLTGLCMDWKAVFPRLVPDAKLPLWFTREVLCVCICLNRAAAERQVPSAVDIGRRAGAYG